MNESPRAPTGLLEGAFDLIAGKVLQDEGALGVKFPYVTDTDGSWKCMFASDSAGYSGENWSHGNWFCGFWVGLLLAGYLRTENREYLRLARERMTLIAPRAEDGNTHDIGFIFLSSAIPGYLITKESWYADLALRAAGRLRARLVTTPGGAYISSWGPLTDVRGRSSSAIDTMANLPLLYWAADFSGDGSYRIAGEAHAQMTQRAFIRDDLSTYHAVQYDTRSGKRTRGYTFQGFSDDSGWSRGQAWAVLGYTATADATRKREYLQLAGKLADYFMHRLGDQRLPPWDFDDPAGKDATRDSAAAAIMASALTQMSELHWDSVERERRRTQALELLERLCTDALAPEQSHRGVLKHGCYSKPHDDGIDSAVLFGDYYFAEALCRHLLPGKFVPSLVVLTE